MNDDEMRGVTLDENGQMLCPVCHDQFSHIGTVGTLLGIDEHEADTYDGTGVIGRTDYRRSALEIHFHGECDHHWSLVIQQHKGCNTISTRTYPSEPIDGE